MREGIFLDYIECPIAEAHALQGGRRSARHLEAVGHLIR